MPAPGGADRGAPGALPARARAVGVAAVARRTGRKQAAAPTAGLLAKGLVQGVGARATTADWTASPNRGTTGATGSVWRSSRRSRGSGGTRALTYVFRPVRYPKDGVDTAAGAMDAEPTAHHLLLIRNPKERRDRTDATTGVQTSSLSRGRPHPARPRHQARPGRGAEGAAGGVHVRPLTPVARHSPGSVAALSCAMPCRHPM